uniref:class I adenylate-forming enzyme family protein n=1 Tax=Rhodococcus qingshengii TaxID=334542 RepID=UPI001C4DFDFE|nr:class I adenylate-forming enzyme family protein [Rhodococcus qingshengii]
MSKRVIPESVWTIPSALDAWSAVQPEAPALTQGGQTINYRELRDKVHRTVSGLSHAGVGPGDRVVLVGVNSIDWVVAYLAILRMGAVVVPTNSRLSEQQFADQCSMLGAVLVLHGVEHRELVAAASTENRTIRALTDLMNGGDHDEATVDIDLPDGDALAMVSFTSGSTGVPKGAMLTHSALANGSRAFKDLMGSGPADSTLILVPMFHNTGFVDQLGHMILAGGHTHLLARFTTADAVAEFAERPVTFVTAVPSILRLLMVAEDADHVFSEAKVVVFGGSPMPAAWTQELLHRWPHLRLIHGYGLTEFTSACTFLPSELVATRGESVGVPAPGVALKIVDSEGRQVGVGVEGEVLLSGPTLMLGYWCQPELTAEKLRDGWLRTGDLGHLDDEGLLWLSGRVDDVINRGGEKVLPAHVESCLAEYPEVSDAVVFGYADPILQNRVAAAIELRSGHYFDGSEIRRRLLLRLPDYAVPESWVIYEHLPRTASGKVDRLEVSRRWQATAELATTD